MGCIHADGGSPNSTCRRCKQESIIGTKITINDYSFGMKPQVVEIIDIWESNIIDEKYLAINKQGKFVFLWKYGNQSPQYSYLNINNLDNKKT